MKKIEIKNIQRKRRTVRIRRKLLATANRPRLTVFRSNVNIYAQIIDDSKATTLVAASSKEIKETKKMEQAVAVGKLIAQKAKTAKITSVVFDKGAYKFHVRVKA
ncbi:MAG: 50S ribosomal protein L18, partial [Candidatus Levybacteria bacterium]|nr:50S ribosomal protein L18 [Candidatus Levybacteria bacterium]